MKITLKSLIVVLGLAFAQNVFAQSPRLIYNPATYTLTLGDSLLRCIPITDGGPIPATTYGAVTTFAGNPLAAAGYTNATGSAAQFNSPQQVAADATGNLYVADANNNVIRKITPAGVVTTYAGSPTGAAGLQDGPAASALFNSPDGIFIDPFGNMFISDYKNNAIREITPDGSTVSTFYKATGVFGPAGMCYDSYQNLIVAAMDANQIISITSAGVATLFAGSTAGYTNGRFSLAQFNKPTDVAFDANGNILVADCNNNAIRCINVYGYVSTFAGSNVPGNTGGYADGTGTAAQFNKPTGIISGPSGVYYITDMANNDIRQMTENGAVSLFAGSKVHTSGDANGMIPAVSFSGPNHITGIGFLTGEYSVYIVEPGTNCIRKIEVTGYQIAGNIPPGLTFNTNTGIMSGKITGAFTTTVDTVTAYNNYGGVSTALTFNYVAPTAISTLSKIALSYGGYYQYTVGSQTNNAFDVPNTVGTLKFTPTPTKPNETVTVNGNDTTIAVNLAIGVNNITVKATSQDGTSSTNYTFAVTRHAAIDATLTYISSYSGTHADTLSPAFNSNITNYTVKLATDTTQLYTTIGIYGAPYQTGSSVTINGTPQHQNQPVILPLGNTSSNVTIVSTASDGVTTQTYTLSVPSQPIYLTNLSAGSGTLYPVFASLTGNYTINVANATTALTITPTLSDPSASVTVNGASVSTPVNLAVGFNNIIVKATSEDGTTTRTYTIGVTRAAPAVPPVTGQAPAIAYGTGNIKVTGTLPFSVQPTNTGGAVPATVYGQVTTFAGSPMVGYANGTGAAAQFNWPQDMVKDASGNIYVTDSYNNNIRMITPAGVVSTYAGSTTGVSGFVDGKDTSARFNFPNGITIDSFGNLYVADFFNNAIRKIAPGGVVTTFYENDAVLSAPGPMIFDNSGNIIVVGQESFNIVKITPAGVGTVLAGVYGPPYNFYTNGPEAQAQFSYPSDIRSDTAGNIYVADASNNAIRKITPAGIVSTFAGSQVPFNTGGYLNGIDTAARFNYPVGVEIGPGGIMYITDMNNNDIRKIMPDGTVSLLAGSPTQATGDDDGTGTAALFNLPTYIRIDNTGTGYISEKGGNRIRKILLTGYTINGTLPTGLAFDATTGKISGTVTAPFATQTDTSTAYNDFGYSSKIITLFYQPVSNIATLANLVPNVGALSPAFVSATTSYADSVSTSVAGITLTPTTTDSTATVTINGTTVASGTASGDISLNIGDNNITVIVTAQDGITTDTYIVDVYRGAAMGSLAATNILTPNGDGKNDLWEVKDIQLYPQNTVNVFDQGGKTVFAKHGYNNDWDGTYNGKPLPQGTYYYVVDLGPNLRKFKGFISILRN